MWCQRLVWSQSLSNLSVIPRTRLLWTWYFLFLYHIFSRTVPRFWQIIVIPKDWQLHLMGVLQCQLCYSLWYCNGTSTLLSCSTIRNCKRSTLRYFLYSYHNMRVILDCLLNSWRIWLGTVLVPVSLLDLDKNIAKDKTWIFSVT